MKKFLIFSVISLLYVVNAVEIIPSATEIHPQILAAIKNYPPLQKGGYRIEKIDEEQYVVIGIGKAKSSTNFSAASRAATLDAELQIAKALNPQQITVKTSKNKTVESSSVEGVISQSSYKKIIERLISSHTPFITSCGFWEYEKYLYCARAVFVGKFEHIVEKAFLKDKVIDFSTSEKNPQLLKIVNQLPYLSHGGTILIKAKDVSYLVTAAIVPINLTPVRRLAFARNQAYKNMIAFISGGNLDQQLISVSERFSSSDGLHKSKRVKRKNLEASVKGDSRFIEPIANWKIADIPCVFFLYAIKVHI